MPGSTNGLSPRGALPAARGVFIWLVLSLLIVTACHANRSSGGLSAEVSDEWTRSYPLSAGGELHLTNKNGPIELLGSDDATIEVKAVRTASAQTEAAARELVGRIAIREQTTSDRVVIETEGIPGILIGVSYKVAYQVKAPSAAKLRLQVSNGDLTVSHVSGPTALSTINGRLVARGLSGGADVRSVNGKLTAEFSAIGSEPILLRTTNGSVDLAVPGDANANLIATTVNGKVDIAGLPFAPMGEPDGRGRSGRRTAGRINAGGTTIEVHTVNGSVAIHPNQTLAERP